MSENLRGLDAWIEYENAYRRRLGEYQSDDGDYLVGHERALGEYGQRAGIAQREQAASLVGRARYQRRLPSHSERTP